TLTTVPVTMSPSSKLTMVPSMASSNDMPPRSSSTTLRKVYSPASLKVPGSQGSGAGAGEVVWSDMGRSAFFPDGRSGSASVALSPGQGYQPPPATVPAAGLADPARQGAAEMPDPSGFGVGPACAPAQVDLQGDREVGG